MAVTSAARLTPLQERDLVIAAEAGDRRACADLVEAFLPEIAGLANTYRHTPGIERRELLQEGVAGLLFAARRFDPALETPFWAYASFWVRKAMQELVAELSRPVALSDRAVRGLAAVRTARADHLREHGVEPTPDQLSGSTGLRRQQVEQLQAAERSPRSLEERLGGGDAPGATVADQLPDPRAEQAFDVVLDDIEVQEVYALAERLDERERYVIRAHYGLGEPARSLREIGTSLGVTAERARQIEAGGLGKLRASLTRSAPVR
ncbi:sigma-70 family RNA polymerase sigma factor [Geodermatophilus sp. SYSU D00766]